MGDEGEVRLQIKDKNIAAMSCPHCALDLQPSQGDSLLSWQHVGWMLCFSAFQGMRDTRGLATDSLGLLAPKTGDRGCLEALPPVPTLLTMPGPSSALLSMPEQLGGASPSSVWLAGRYLGAAELQLY